MAKKQKKQYGMGPGQSMAMAGNTGLASFTQKDIEKVQQEKRAYNDFSGRDRNERASYTDIGQEIDELASKYRRPVKIADGFGAYSDGSGRAYTPNDFNADGSFRSFTATQPTASQVFGRDGDVRRAFKGYNTLKYDDPGRGYSPVSMRYNRGMYEQGGGLPGLVSNMVSPGSGFVMQALRDLVSGNDDLANKVKPLYSGTVDLFKKGLGTLNDVKQQIFMNPEKYKFMQEDEEIKKLKEKEDEVNKLETLNEKIEADRKQFEDLLNISVTDNYYRNRMQQDDAYRLDSTSNMPGGTPITANIPGGRPIGTANAPGGTPIGTANAPGGRGNFLDSDAYREMLLNNYQEREMGTGNMPGGVDLMGLPVQGDITTDVNKDLIIPFINETPIGELDTNSGIKSLNEFDVRSLGGNNVLSRDNNNAFGDEASNSITPYLNPGNLVDVGQAGTSGKTYGENKFAIFNTVDDGLRALTKDLNKKVGDFDGDVEKIISKYASGDPNANNYINFIKDKVGSTVEKDEIPTLVESVIAMENKPEIAEQYLDYLQKNADKIYGGIISSKNNTMLAEITQADIDRFKQPMTQTMDYDTYKSINTDSTLTPDEFNQLKARVA